MYYNMCSVYFKIEHLFTKFSDPNFEKRVRKSLL